MMKLDSKIISLAKISEWRSKVRKNGQQLVVTNGCFDILHVGHIRYLHSARKEGDLLLVGLNGDESIRQLKGDGRPVNPEPDRALLLAALECVDAVCIFPEQRASSLKPNQIFMSKGGITRWKLSIQTNAGPLNPQKAALCSSHSSPIAPRVT